MAKSLDDVVRSLRDVESAIESSEGFDALSHAVNKTSRDMQGIMMMSSNNVANGLRNTNEAIEQERAALTEKFSEMGMQYRDAIANGRTELQQTLKKNREAIADRLSKLAETEKQNNMTSQSQNAELIETIQQTGEETQKSTENSSASMATRIKEGIGKKLRQTFGLPSDQKEKDKREDTWRSKMLDNFKSFGQKLANLPGIKQLSSFFNIIKDALLLGVALLGAGLSLQGFLKGWEKAETWFGANADFGDKVASGFAGILKAFGLIDNEEGIAKKLSKVFHGVADALSPVIDALGNFVGVIGGSLLKLISSDGFIGTIKLLGEAVGGLINLVTSVVKGLFGIWEFQFDMVRKIGGFVGEMVVKVPAFFKEGIQNVKDGISNLFMIMKNDILDIADFFTAGFKTIYNSIVDFINSMLDKIPATFRPKKLEKFAEETFERKGIRDAQEEVSKLSAADKIKSVAQAINENENLTAEQKDIERKRLGQEAQAGNLAYINQQANNYSTVIANRPEVNAGMSNTNYGG